MARKKKEKAVEVPKSEEVVVEYSSSVPIAKPNGRPTIFTQELADAICTRIAEGESVRSICKDETMPSGSTLFRWLLDEDKKIFWEQYARARDIQAELMFEEILEIADQSDQVVRSGAEKKSSAFSQNQRLKVDTRKWYLSKVLPKKFGDKLDLTSDGKPIPLLNVLHNDSNKEDSSTQPAN